MIDLDTTHQWFAMIWTDIQIIIYNLRLVIKYNLLRTGFQMTTHRHTLPIPALCRTFPITSLHYVICILPPSSPILFEYTSCMCLGGCVYKHRCEYVAVWNSKQEKIATMANTACSRTHFQLKNVCNTANECLHYTLSARPQDNANRPYQQILIHWTSQLSHT